MQSRTLGRSLGLFSLALGLAEVVAGKRIARLLGQRRDRSRIVKGFGARELATGAFLLARPTSAIGPALRVAGDALDLATTAAAARRPQARRTPILATAAFVGVALIADILATRKLAAA